MDGAMQPKTQPRNIANAMSDSVGDTPAGDRSVDHRLNVYRNSTLNGGRTAIVSDLGQSIPEVDLKLLINNILPLLRNRFEIDEIVGADGMIGRDTRAFKVTQSTGIEYALEYAWFEDDRKLELEIHRELLEDIKTFVRPAEEVIARKHLLAPKYHSKAIINEQEDHTCEVVIRNAISINDAAKGVALSCVSDNEAHLGTRAPRNNTRKLIHHRIYYRVILDEATEPVHKKMNWRSVSVSLKYCTEILSYMHRAGWVHHDLSYGNIYLYKGRGLWGDLEYAKKMGTHGKHEVRTGTLDLMAVEVANRSYMHAINRSYMLTAPLTMNEEDAFINSISKVSSKAKLHEEGKGALTDWDARYEDAPTFFYNELHDLESMWWIPVWMLFFHDDQAQPMTDELRRASRHFHVRRFFPGDLNISGRQKLLVNEKSFAEAIKCLPESFSFVIEALNHQR
ncbi:hypothetical protein M0805_008804, partial [Coniferiporia weirii]